jgi:uncharacterized membrane protein YbhN (UPF0104 family)
VTPRLGLRGSALRRWGPWVGTVLGLAVLYGLIRQGQHVDWRAVQQALVGLERSTLLMAVLLAVASHALYAVFDLLARRYTGHRVPAAQVLAIGACSYAVNLNLGTLLGGVAVRARLYAARGLDLGCIGRIVGFAAVSNWLGYLLLAGTFFTLAPPALPAGWEVGHAGLRWVGVAAWLAVLAYLGLCALMGGRALVLRGRPWRVPSVRLGAAQLLVSCAHWACMGALLAVLFEGRLPYALVLGVLLMAAVAGLIAHIPAGLGVIEAVFVALLASQLPTPHLLAGLLLYRVLFYWVPLAVGAALYGRMEATALKQAVLKPPAPSKPRHPRAHPRH